MFEKNPPGDADPTLPSSCDDRDLGEDLVMSRIRLGGVTGSPTEIPARGDVDVGVDALSADDANSPLDDTFVILSSNGAGHVPFDTASRSHISLNANTAFGSPLSPAAAANNQHIFVASRSDRRLDITIIRSKLSLPLASTIVPPSNLCIHIVTI
tara:strand:+ start:3297 stop:3761 length:465 start_codon:yes stop_codon:yes gene_type:complete